jgi:hypothetical protein
MNKKKLVSMKCESEPDFLTMWRFLKNYAYTDVSDDSNFFTMLERTSLSIWFVSRNKKSLEITAYLVSETSTGKDSVDE